MLVHEPMHQSTGFTEIILLPAPPSKEYPFVSLGRHAYLFYTQFHIFHKNNTQTHIKG